MFFSHYPVKQTEAADIIICLAEEDGARWGGSIFGEEKKEEDALFPFFFCASGNRMFNLT